MDDWRIDKNLEKEYEEVYKGIKFLQIIFPEFWQRALKTKNNFFKYVFAEAERHVELLGIGQEYLTDDLCQEWWQRHCNFCMKSITTEMKEKIYCSGDGSDWVCDDCFNDFKERFEWTVHENAQDIPAEGFTALDIVVGTKGDGRLQENR